MNCSLTKVYSLFDNLFTWKKLIKISYLSRVCRKTSRASLFATTRNRYIRGSSRQWMASQSTVRARRFFTGWTFYEPARSFYCLLLFAIQAGSLAREHCARYISLTRLTLDCNCFQKACATYTLTYIHRWIYFNFKRVNAAVQESERESRVLIYSLR